MAVRSGGSVIRGRRILIFMTLMLTLGLDQLVSLLLLLAP